MRRTPVLTALPAVLLATIAAAQQEDRPEFPQSMDFGPWLTTTFDGRGQSGFTHKGLVVKLGDKRSGAAGAVAFDTELLRLSAAWTDGWLQLRGTAYDGAHGPMPALRGHKIAETRSGPGWAKDGSFDDPREVPYGPLPKSWGSYVGHWVHGDRVVIGYRVGGMEVREAHSLETAGDARFIARHFEFGPCDQEQRMVVADAPAGVKPGIAEAALPTGGAVPTTSFAVLQWQEPSPGLVELSSSTTSWERLSMGGPSAHDYLDRQSNTGAVVRFAPQFARAHGHPAPKAGLAEDPAALLLPELHDGKAARSDNDREQSVWFDKRGDNDDGRFVVDLQKSVDVSRVSTFSWHRGQRAVQEYDLFGSAAEAAPAVDAKDPAAAGWQQLAKVRTGELGQGDKHGASVAKAGGLGQFRHLLFVVRSGSALFSEIDVFADRFRAAVDSGERPPRNVAAALKGQGAELLADGGRLLLRIPPHKEPLRCKLLLAGGDNKTIDAFAKHLPGSAGADELGPLLVPGPARWGAPIVTKGERAKDDAAYVADTLTIPFDNRFGSRMRVCAFDFFHDGRAAITTWNGDVWLVDGIDRDLAQLKWTRFATGLHDPLGLKIVDDVVYVHGRDGITRLFDGNNDGEADFYQCFNHDVAVTNAFHEFAFDLQTDAQGNFYCSKGGPVNPGGRGFMKIAPHHGTIMKISPDGGSLEVIASGLRAPNGIGVSPDGIVTSGDNEGTWMPRCRLNWITKPGFYAGVKDTAHRSPVPDQPDLPLCWMPMEVDNSGGSQVWVTSDQWGPLQGRLLHLSYGTCSVYLVLKEQNGEQVQGGVVRLPVNFSSSAMRARFHPVDGQLYVAGFQGWQTSAAREGGFHRVRYTQQPVPVPVALRTCDQGVYLTFLEPLDGKTAGDPQSYGVEIWNYLYSQNYGSPELSILHPERKVEQGKENRDPLPVTAATLSPDRCTVFLRVGSMQPAMQMKIRWDVDSAAGKSLRGELHNSVHSLVADPGFPAAH